MLLKVAFTSKCVVATITFNVQLLLYYQVVTFVIVQAHRKKDTGSTYPFTIAILLICGRLQVFSSLFLKQRWKKEWDSSRRVCSFLAPLIFSVDKDFDYINVIEYIFPGCIFLMNEEMETNKKM